MWTNIFWRETVVSTSPVSRYSHTFELVEMNGDDSKAALRSVCAYCKGMVFLEKRHYFSILFDVYSSSMKGTESAH